MTKELELHTGLQAAQPKSQSRALPVDRHHAGLTQPECDTGTIG
jgi:hypothetical protein